MTKKTTTAEKPKPIRLGKKNKEVQVFDDLETPPPLKTVETVEKPKTITVAELLSKR